MKPFMTLEEFLAMPTGFVILHAPAAHWLSLFRTAKESYEKYGDDGPPPGSIVRSLASGYGGGAGVRLTYYGTDPARPTDMLLTGRDGDYVCDKATWWREFAVISEPKEVS